jgi:hypothetical protein
MASVRQRLSELPDPVHTIVVALSLSVLYFTAAVVLELSGLTGRLPLAPKPWLGLGASIVTIGIVVGLFRAAGWVRPLVALVPLVTYPMEYGLNVPTFASVQSLELLAVLVLMPAAVVYYLYFEPSSRLWFSAP